MAATLSFGASSQFVSADSSSIDFEGYTLGNPNGQDGWVFIGAYDAAIAGNTSGSATFGTKSLRISNASTSGSFGDWVFSKPLANEAGETAAANDGLSGGTRQPYFEMQFDVASAVPNAEQPGLQISTSADRGDGARMTYLRFNDTPAGLDVTFADYQQSASDFVVTTVASGLDRSVPHRIRMTVQFVDGPANDVVMVYIDGNLVHTGTTWEGYFPAGEGVPTRTVDSILFQARTSAGTATGTSGAGFLFDNLSLYSGPVPVPPCTTVCYVDAVNGSDSNAGDSIATAFKTIQKAIDTVQPNGTVRVLPGVYSESAPNSTLTTGGTYQFGLFFPDSKPGISVIGVDASDNPITNYAGVLATVNTNATNNFGPSGIFVEADNITLQGLRIGTNSAGQNKTIEVIGDGFALKNSEINDPDGSVYLNDFRFDTGTNTSRVKSYTIEGNRFVDGVSLDIASGAGFSGPVTGRKIINNKFEFGPGDNWAVISFSGSGSGVPWYVYSVGGAIIQGNAFSGGEQYIRARADYDNSQYDWASYWNDNTYDKAAVALVTETPFDVRTYSYTSGSYTFNNVRRIGAMIQPEVDNAQSGDTVLVKAGTYVEQVVVTKTLTLKSESGAVNTFIKAPATIPVAANPDSTIVKIGGAGVNVELTGFTVAGPGPGSCGTIFAGIFVRDGATANIHDNRVLDIRDDDPSGDAPFSGCQNGIGIVVGRQQIGTSGSATIKNNEIAGYQKNGIVVSNVGSSALIEGNTVAGFGPQTTIAQNGVQVSAGAIATVQNNTIKDHQCNHSTCGPDVMTQVQSAGVLLFSAGTGTVVKGNLIQANDMGVYNVNGDTTVIENTLTANRYAGIVADQGKITLNANEITGASNIGVVVVSYNGNTANSEVALTNNLIKDATEGIKLVDETTSDAFIPVFSGSLNSIAGSSSGMNNTTAGAATAEKNWWGNSTGPANAGNPGGTGAAVAGSVDFDPWLCDGTDTSPSIGFQPNDTTLCTLPGAISLTKVVDWNGAVVNNAQTFELCVSGGALATPICQNFGANGGTQTVSGLQPGEYTVNETDPGSAWTVTGNSGTVVVASNATANSTITNQLKRGSISVQKVVDWSGVPANNSQTFSICLSGPSFPTPDCKSFGANGGTQTWSDLIPGSYVVTEADPGASWTVTGNNATVVLSAGGSANASVTNTYRTASLTVTKTVNWNGAPPAAGISFQICVTGPSYATPNCKTFTPGQTQTWSPLIPGNYTVNETDPGANWSVTGNGAVVAVAPAQNATARIINVLRPGTLKVIKVVNTQGATGLSQNFSICVTGPSYAAPDCKTVGVAGGTLLWGPVVPGVYTVVEANPGANWTVAGNNATVTVNAAQTGSTTITNTYANASFTCSVLDNFNRSNGKLGNNWTGATGDYRVKDNTAYVDDDRAGIIEWYRVPVVFGANQSACLTLTKIDTNSEKHALILKAQSTDASKGMIKVAYVPKYKRVDVWSIQPGQNWVKRATISNVTFVNGDRFGARAYADGTVRVYKNGAQIGTSPTSSYFVNRSGRIGVWFYDAEGARFDDFGGGNFTP